MLLLKSCPRCTTGDLIVAKDWEEASVTCLQCGYTGDYQTVRRIAATRELARGTAKRSPAPRRAA